MAINDARQLYPTMHNEYYNSRLSKHFKQTFYDYLPAKEDECHFDAPPTVKVIKKDPKWNELLSFLNVVYHKNIKHTFVIKTFV